jgi:hypothetical protein
VFEFYLKLKLILLTYQTYYICWEIDNFVIKSDIFRQFFICKNVLNFKSCYHDNYFRYFMFRKCNGFVSKARVSACMHAFSSIGTVCYTHAFGREGVWYIFSGILCLMCVSALLLGLSLGEAICPIILCNCRLLYEF